MANKTRKNIVLFALFIVPLLFYILLQLSTHNFGKLPVAVKNVTDVNLLDKNISMQHNVSVVYFAGINSNISSTELFNLNEKVYKKFHDYPNFQFVTVFPLGSENEIDNLKKKISSFVPISKWKFIVATSDDIQTVFNSFNSTKSLDANFHCSEAFIIDKDLCLRRGKTIDKSDKSKRGYNSSSIAELKNEMFDDVKILLAEYNFALKKNNRKRPI